MRECIVMYLRVLYMYVWIRQEESGYGVATKSLIPKWLGLFR